MRRQGQRRSDRPQYRKARARLDRVRAFMSAKSVPLSHRNRLLNSRPALPPGGPQERLLARLVARLEALTGGYFVCCRPRGLPVLGVQPSETLQRCLMKSIALAAVVMMAVASLSPSTASAAGCIKGAVVGGVAGHFAG